MQELTTIGGHQVPVAVLDQYLAACLGGLLANAELLRELNMQAIQANRQPRLLVAREALNQTLVAIVQRNKLLYPEAPPQASSEEGKI